MASKHSKSKPINVVEINSFSLDSFDMRAAMSDPSMSPHPDLMKKSSVHTNKVYDQVSGDQSNQFGYHADMSASMSPQTDMMKKSSLQMNDVYDQSYNKVDPVIMMEEGKRNDSTSALSESIVPSATLFQKVGAEFVAVFVLVFVGCGDIVVDAKNGGVIAHVGVAWGFGIVITIMIYATGHISGAHINPAVTFAFATVGRFPWRQVPAYLAAQITGAIVASFALRAILHDVKGLAVNHPSGTDVQSFLMEAIITFILMFVISGVATDARAIGELAGLAIGSTIAVNGIFAGPVSGGSMNPARSIGPAVVARDFASLWVYILGPTIGAMLGAWSYNLIRLPAPPKTEGGTSKSFFKSWRKG